MTIQHLEEGVFGEVHPVTITGTVEIKPNVYTRAQAAEFGNWSTYSFLGTETQPVRVCARDQYRSRVLLIINAPAGSSTDPAPVVTTSPGANAVLASAVLPAGTYQVNWTVTLAGTLLAADRNNVGLYLNNVLLYTSDNNINVGTVYQQNPTVVTIPAGGGTLSLQTIAPGTGSSVYDASFTATSGGGSIWIGTQSQLSRASNPQGGRLFTGNYEIKDQLEHWIIPDGVNPVTVTVLTERYDAYPDEPIVNMGSE
jgi:hypothetical protein